MQSIFLSYRSSSIHILCFGGGDKTILAFHGFSENGKSFLCLQPSLGKKFTVYAFDLPYHGDTKWNEKEHFTPGNLDEIVKQFLAEHNINQFSLLGFSMGGKCALHLVKSFPEKIEELFLLASDGIETNKVYNVAVYPKWGRSLFKTTINKPGWFFFMVNALYKTRILSPWLYKFTTNHMNTKEKRQRVYDTWISMAEFNPDVNEIKSAINKYEIKTKLIFGKRDEVIKPQVGEKFAEGLHSCELKIIDRGHYFIDEKLNGILEGILEP